MAKSRKVGAHGVRTSSVAPQQHLRSSRANIFGATGVAVAACLPEPLRTLPGMAQSCQLKICISITYIQEFRLLALANVYKNRGPRRSNIFAPAIPTSSGPRASRWRHISPRLSALSPAWRQYLDHSGAMSLNPKS